eukprot:1320302-Amorphochlora_amoeboformis.AAC.1
MYMSHCTNFSEGHCLHANLSERMGPYGLFQACALWAEVYTHTYTPRKLCSAWRGMSNLYAEEQSIFRAIPRISREIFSKLSEIDTRRRHFGENNNGGGQGDTVIAA